jgi:hypothetical protein
MTAAQLNNLVLNVITTDMQPVSIVEESGFRHLVILSFLTFFMFIFFFK